MFMWGRIETEAKALARIDERRRKSRDMLTVSRSPKGRVLSSEIHVMTGQAIDTDEWATINWRKLEVAVFRLQKRIFQATERGDKPQIRKLQRLLVNSRASKLLAVRRVTQENKGKRTAGVDGVKSLTPKQRLELASSLKLKDKASPLRRVEIPKPGTDEKRPLGIPTIYDRALQGVLKLALEPEWEARFEANSYGFRPGRSALDARSIIHKSLIRTQKYVLDADIAKCFDRISHEALLKKLDAPPYIRRQIKAWLKCGVMVDYSRRRELQKTEAGTPQGGVISPLLANIALHGMENDLRKFMGYTGNKAYRLAFIRYADDFVILHENLEEVRKAKVYVEKWLKTIGLELKEAKTRIAHTYKKFGEQEPGFDFLGSYIRQYPVSKHKKVNCGFGKWVQFKVRISPSKKNLKAHTDSIRVVLKNGTTKPQFDVIKKLNPIITGWCNYHCTSPGIRHTFEKMEWTTWQMLRGWARRRVGKSGNPKQYWRKVTYLDKKTGKIRNCQRFSTTAGFILTPHTDAQTVTYAKVKDKVSPFNGDWAYWSKRRGEYPGTPTRVAKLLKTQKGKCWHCGLYINSDDELEVHHIDKHRRNNAHNNLALVHIVCHDRLHGKGEVVSDDNG